MVDVRIKFSLDAIRLFVIWFYTYIAYTCVYSPVSVPGLYGSIALKNCFLYFLRKGNSQLITDFPHHPDMSTPHIQELGAVSDDLTVSGSSVPSDPVNFETGWLVSCQTWWKMDWRWWKMLMLGIGYWYVFIIFCCFDVLIEPRRWSLFLFVHCTLLITPVSNME